MVGDILSLTSSGNNNSNQTKSRSIPADVLLLEGGAVVNEAMLTGESVPQIKESIDVVASASMDAAADTDANNIPTSVSESTSSNAATNEPRLDIEDSNYKRAILFGGTFLVNHSPSSENNDDSTTTPDNNPISTNRSSPPPPDGGCTGLILRTGFATQQGSLLRIMVHTSTKSQNNGVNTKDTFLFIVILLLCAIGSSVLILQHGWNDPTRNRFKLVFARGYYYY